MWECYLGALRYATPARQALLLDPSIRCRRTTLATGQAGDDARRGAEACGRLRRAEHPRPLTSRLHALVPAGASVCTCRPCISNRQQPSCLLPRSGRYVSVARPCSSCVRQGPHHQWIPRRGRKSKGKRADNHDRDGMMTAQVRGGVSASVRRTFGIALRDLRASRPRDQSETNFATRSLDF